MHVHYKIHQEKAIVVQTAFDIRLYCHDTSLDHSNYPYTHLSVSYQLHYKIIKGYKKYFKEKVASKIFARVIVLSVKLKNRALHIMHIHIMHTRYSSFSISYDTFLVLQLDIGL